MVQCLGTLAAALPGDLGLIPGIYTVVHNDLLTSGDLPLSSGLHRHQDIYVVHRCICRQNTHSHNFLFK